MQTRVSEVASSEFASPGVPNLLRRTVIDVHKVGRDVHQLRLDLEALNGKTNSVYLELKAMIDTLNTKVDTLKPRATATRKTRNNRTRRNRNRK
jgi:hypothetical protein